jgi:hypothetical protein
MNIFALLAYAVTFFSGFSNGLYLYRRESSPGLILNPRQINTDSLGQLTDEDLPTKITSGTNNLDFNEDGIGIGIIGFSESSLESAIRQSQELWDGDNGSIGLFGAGIGSLNDQRVTGYAPSPHVPFLVQVKARDSIPSPKIGTVLNSELSKADDPLPGNAGLPAPDTSGQPVVSEGVPLIGASTSEQASVNGILLLGGVTGVENILATGSEPLSSDNIAGLDSGPSGGDLSRSDPAYTASTTNLGFQGQDSSSGFTANSDLAIGLGPVDGVINSNLAFAFVDGVPTSGKSSVTATSNSGDSFAPVRLTDPLFAEDATPSPNSGLVAGFSSPENDGNIFSTSLSATNSGSVASFGVVTLASTLLAEDSAKNNGNDGDSNSNSGSQDGAYWRNNEEEADADDPCKLLHDFSTPYDECTAGLMRSLYSPFKVPAVPRPDLDIATDDVS